MSPNRIAFRYANLAHLTAHLVMLLYPTVVLALEAETGRGYAELLALLTAGNVLFGLGAPLAGWLGDRWGAAPMMVLFFVGTGLACLATGASGSPLGLAVGLAAVGLFASIYHPVGVAWLVRDPEGRGRRLGVNGIYGSLGVASAGVVAGGLSDAFGWRAAFWVPGAVSLIAGVTLFRAWRSGSLAEPRPVDGAPPEAGPERGRARVFALLAGTMLVGGMTYQAVATAMPKLLAQRIPSLAGGGAAEVGTVVSAVYLLAAASQLLGGHLADRFSGRLLYGAAYLALAPLLGAAAFLSGAPLLIVLAVAVFVNTAAIPVENVLLAEYSPPGWRGSVYGGKFVLVFGVTGLAVPLVAWFYASGAGCRGLLLLLAGAVLLVPVLAARLPERRRCADALATPAGR